MKFSQESQQVSEKYDVIVLGGGPAGVSAAIASREMGAKTLLIERYGYLGGMSTGSYVIALCGFFDGKKGKRQIIAGNFMKMAERLVKEGHAEWTRWGKWIKNSKDKRELTVDPEGMKYTLDRIVLDANVHVSLHSFATARLKTYSDDNTIEALRIESKQGMFFVEGKTFVDASGDADLAEWCDIICTEGKVGITLGLRIGGFDISKMDLSKPEKLYFPNTYSDEDSIDLHGWPSVKNKNGEMFYDCMHICRYKGLDGLKVQDLTYAEMEGRMVAQEFIKRVKKVSGFETAYIAGTGTHLGARKTRHPILRYYLSDEDENCDFDDSIAIAGNVMRDIGYMKIPFRALLPKKIKNLIFCGRCISPHGFIGKSNNFIAYEIPRLVPVCMATGEAAGIAAAMAVDKNIPIYNVDVKELQSKLKARGAIF